MATVGMTMKQAMQGLPVEGFTPPSGAMLGAAHPHKLTFPNS
jgi:hypothetical protein